MSDLKTAFRAMRGHPGFSTIVILTMAVGIAVNAEIFSVCDRLVLHPVTIPDPSSLVAIWFNNPQRNVQTPSSSVPRYEELRAEVRAFSSIGEVVGVMPPRLSVPFGQVQVLAPRVFETGGLTPAQIEAGGTFAPPIARLKAGSRSTRRAPNSPRSAAATRAGTRRTSTPTTSASPVSSSPPW